MNRGAKTLSYVLILGVFLSNPVQICSAEGFFMSNSPTQYNLAVPKLLAEFSANKDSKFSKIIEAMKKGTIVDKVAQPTIVDIEKMIKANDFLRAFFAEESKQEIINRIIKDPKKHAFSKAVLSLLVSHYDWVSNDPTYESNMEEVKNDIFKVIFEALVSISNRLESGDLVPDSADLKLSKKDNITPKVKLNRPLNSAFYAMKGDPWQLGHMWVVLQLLADGRDIVEIMLDNSDPDRKPNLTSLAMREAENSWIFKAFSPYVRYAQFQREYRALFTADGETILPTIIYENRDIIDMLKSEYIAGYDHFNWVVKKKGKNFLDVPYKLFFGWTKLFDAGINAHISARFQKRNADSKDVMGYAQAKVPVIESLAKLSVVEYMIKKIKEDVEYEKQYGGNKAFLNSVIAWADKFSGAKKAEIKSSLKRIYYVDKTGKTRYVDQKKLFDKYYKEGKAALGLAESANVNVKNWFDRLKPATKWSENKKHALTDWMTELKNMQNATNVFNEKVGRKLIDDLESRIKVAYMNFEVINQPMDLSATNVREHGKLYTVAVPIAQSIVAMQRYPAYIEHNMRIKDKKVASDILAKVIDLNLMRENKHLLHGELIKPFRMLKDEVTKKILEESSVKINKKNMNILYDLTSLLTGEKELTSDIIDEIKKYTKDNFKDLQYYFKDIEFALEDKRQISKEMLKKHIGRNLAESVDIEVLVEKVNERLENNDFDSILLYNKDKEFSQKIEQFENDLKSAYGIALNAVDGYLAKFLTNEQMFNGFKNLLIERGANYGEDKIIELVDMFRLAIHERALQVVKESRKIDLIAYNKARTEREKAKLKDVTAAGKAEFPTDRIDNNV